MTTPPTDLAYEFAHLVARARYEDLPPAAVDAAKKSVLDTLGVILAGSGMEPRVRGIVDLVLETGGRAESTVLGFGGRVPAMQAALANGAMAHCLDFDDRTPWGAHADSSALPAALALAERKGGVSGQRLITALALAQDLFTRLRYHVGWRQDWNLSPVLGAFSATAAASHVLGLNAERAAHALGIASTQAGGTMETIFAAGSDLRGMYAGFTAHSAVTAALLAEKGITGIPTLFEGKAGIFNTYFSGKYEREKMLENLGKDYRGALTLYKPWPVVGIAHTYIHATIELMKQHHLHPDDIEQIRVWVGTFQQRMCHPLGERQAPAKPVDAKFSLPFCVALAAAHGTVKISDFTEAALRDPAVLAVARKVMPVEDERYDFTTQSPEARVAIALRDGRVVERIGDQVPGSPDAPLTWDGITAKFRDCASVAAKPVAAQAIVDAQAMARHLESLDDATALVRALVTPA
jgi:2-methylcitrate dehydratase PrpD